MNIHVFHNLLKEYDNVMELMKTELSNTTNPLIMTSVREWLWSRYAKLKKIEVVNKKNDDEKALAEAEFLGQCY